MPITAQLPIARCIACRLRREVCLCDAIPTVPTRTRMLVVRHVRERLKASNTGRLAHRCLPNSELVDIGRRDDPPLADMVSMPDTWLLYPEGPAFNPAATAARPKQVVIVDATWHQARHMRTRLTELRGLPILSLPAPAAPPQRLRRAPRALAMSTIEAIAAALRLLEGDAVAGPLEQIYQVMVQGARAFGQRPGPD